MHVRHHKTPNGCRTNVIDDNGPALEQHCPDVPRRPHAHPRAYSASDTREYTRLCYCMRAMSVTSMLGQH